MRTLDDLPEPATPEDIRIERVNDLEPWAEVTRNGTWGAWSDDPLPEGYRVFAETRGFARYLVTKDGTPVAAAMAFVADGTALVADVTAASDTYDPDVQIALWSWLLHDAAKEADLAWVETDDDVVHMEAERSGFHLLYSQLVFSVPAA